LELYFAYFGAKALLGGFFMARHEARLGPARVALLYCAHLQLLGAGLMLASTRTGATVFWAAAAVAWLGVALGTGDLRLGRSAIVVLAAAAAKAVLFDFTGDAPLGRAAVLALGVALVTATSWLYETYAPGRAKAAPQGTA
jgi:hypothetical protein